MAFFYNSSSPFIKAQLLLSDYFSFMLLTNLAKCHHLILIQYALCGSAMCLAIWLFLFTASDPRHTYLQ